MRGVPRRSATRPAARPARSLRHRLVLGVTVLATAAVMASQLIGFIVLHSWLLDRVDRQLADFPPPAFVYTAALRQQLPQTLRGSLPSDYQVYFYDADGHRQNHWMGQGGRPGPLLPDSAADLHLRTGHPETVSAQSGHGHGRVQLSSGPSGMHAVVALPLDTVDGATSKILWLDGVLLAALIALGRWVVRLGLLPLTRMGSTAENITAGRLDLRVPDTDPNTEIGRLGQVLNSMLDRLRTALLEREASEVRLRRFVADAGHELPPRSPPSRGTPNLPCVPNRAPRTSGARPAG